LFELRQRDVQRARQVTHLEFVLRANVEHRSRAAAETVEQLLPGHWLEFVAGVEIARHHAIFGDWTVMREWGRRGSSGTVRLSSYQRRNEDSEQSPSCAPATASPHRPRKVHAAFPRQMELFIDLPAFPSPALVEEGWRKSLGGTRTMRRSTLAIALAALVTTATPALAGMCDKPPFGMKHAEI
jgi:hypothetical protein